MLSLSLSKHEISVDKWCMQVPLSLVRLPYIKTIIVELSTRRDQLCRPLRFPSTKKKIMLILYVLAYVTPSTASRPCKATIRPQ